MDNLLPPSLYGIDVAMVKLRPGATFQLEGTTFTQWSDPNGLEAPTWEEVQAQVELDRAAAEEISAAHKLLNEPVAEQVNAVNIPPELLKIPPNPTEDELKIHPSNEPGLIIMAEEHGKM